MLNRRTTKALFCYWAGSIITKKVNHKCENWMLLSITTTIVSRKNNGARQEEKKA